MFDFLKRDPAKEKQKIPSEVFSVTAAGAVNACNILNGAGLRGRFNRDALFAEVCGFHIKTVIATMIRVEDYVGFTAAFDKGAKFLLENAPNVLARLRDPQVSSGLRTQGFTSEDLNLMANLLFAETTFQLAATYYTGMDLDVSEEDLLEFGRKYNPKLLALSSEDRSNSIYAYIVRCVRLSHLEEIPHQESRTSCLVRFNDTLFQAALEMEKNVENLLSKA